MERSPLEGIVFLGGDLTDDRQELDASGSPRPVPMFKRFSSNFGIYSM